MPFPPASSQHVLEVSSDYGSDPDEEALNIIYSSIPSPALEVKKQRLIDIEDYEDPKGVKLPKTLGKKVWELAPRGNGTVHLAGAIPGEKLCNSGGATAGNVTLLRSLCEY